VQVTLTADEYETVRRLAFRTRQSQSKVIADLVHDAFPVLLRVADTLDAAASLTEEARAQLVSQAAVGEAKVQKLATQALTEWSKFEASVQAGRPAVRSAAAGRPARRRKTPGQ
jgi:hypothetical protein